MEYFLKIIDTDGKGNFFLENFKDQLSEIIEQNINEQLYSLDESQINSFLAKISDFKKEIPTKESIENMNTKISE